MSDDTDDPTPPGPRGGDTGDTGDAKDRGAAADPPSRIDSALQADDARASVGRPAVVRAEAGMQLLGARLKRTYTVVSEMGARGAFGVLWLATYIDTDGTTQQVALKEFDRGQPILPDQAAKEYRRGEHRGKHVVRSLDHSAPGAPTAFVVMDFLEGQNLLNLRDAGPLDTQQLALLLECLGSALAAFYDASNRARRMYHGDLQPKNVMWVPGGDLGSDIFVVVDLGHGHFEDSQTTRTAPAAVYRTPEMLLALDDVMSLPDIRDLANLVDVHQAAQLIGFAVTGHSFCSAGITRAMMAEVNGDLVAAVLDCWPSIGQDAPGLASLLARMLTPDLHRRGLRASVESVAQELKEIGAALRSAPTRVIGIPEQEGAVHPHDAAAICAGIPREVTALAGVSAPDRIPVLLVASESQVMLGWGHPEWDLSSWDSQGVTRQRILDVVVAGTSEAGIEVFAAHPGGLNHRWREQGQWKYGHMNTPGQGTLTAVSTHSRAEGHQELVVALYDGRIYHRVRADGPSRWSPWEQLEGLTLTKGLAQLTSCGTLSTRQELFALLANGDLLRSRYYRGAWHQWQAIEKPSNVERVVACHAFNRRLSRFDLVVADDRGRLFRRGWSDKHPLGYWAEFGAMPGVTRLTVVAGPDRGYVSFGLVGDHVEAVALA